MLFDTDTPKQTQDIFFTWKKGTTDHGTIYFNNTPFFKENETFGSISGRETFFFCWNISIRKLKTKNNKKKTTNKDNNVIKNFNLSLLHFPLTAI